MVAISGVGVASAFAAGAVSFLSPCVLPLVPGYLSYIAGQDLEEIHQHPGARLRTLALSAPFVLGFSTVFILLGLGATALGRLLLAYRTQANLVGGGIVMVFGLFMLGLLRIPWLNRDLRLAPVIRSGRPAGAYVLGVAFALGWTPCIGPVLGSILTVGATAAAGNAAALLATYSAGLAVPFLLVALFTGAFLRRARTVGRAGRILYKAAGVVLVLFGLAMATGQLGWLSYWLLNAFPALSRVG